MATAEKRLLLILQITEHIPTRQIAREIWEVFKTYTHQEDL